MICRTAVPTSWKLAFLLAFSPLLGACGGDDSSPTEALFSLDGDWSQPDQFYDFPFPSDLRLSGGRPDMTGFPNARANPVVDGMLSIAADREGWSTLPVGYVHFTAALAPRDPLELIPARPDAAALLIDIDEGSPERGRLYPTVATVPEADDYVPANLLAIASWPGFVLHPKRRYAFVVTDALLDAGGQPVAASPAFAALRAGKTSGVAADLYAPLWSTLDQAGVPRERVVAATVFTTGDAVADTAALGDAVVAAHDVTIEGLTIDPDDGADHPGFCELVGSVSFPQFQVGTPPFDSDGLFVIGGDGLPIEQRRETAPVVINIPKAPMPAGGYPLVMYFHGSGGLAGQVVDRGRVTEPGGEPTKGEGPAHVLAAHGFASVGSAHPVNPERLPGASEIAYLNFDNLKAFRDTFRQGVLEQRLYLEALSSLTIDPALLASCAGPTLPAGETSFHFASAPVFALGQSMGGMYTNMIGATEPRIEAVVPTGAGGFWSYFILETSLVGGDVLIPILLGSSKQLTHLHPALALFELSAETAEPMVYMPRLARRPLAGHPVRSIYEPIGKGDSYFPTQLYDAIVLAYGHPQAGDEVWETMQPALALDGLDGFVDYSVSGNLDSETGGAYTGVVVQYEGDGIYDPHAIFGQLDAVKHQYGCFLETALAGQPTVVAPAPLGSPCTP